MDNLRLILLIIGCLIVLGIYLWEIYNNNIKKKIRILNAVDETPDNPLSSTNTDDICVDNYSTDVLTDIGGLLAQGHKQDIHINDTLDEVSKVTLPLEMSIKTYESSMNQNNESEVFTAIKGNIYGGERREDENNFSDECNEQEENIEKALIPESNKSSNDILVLYITSPSHISFNGLSISKAADEVGMIYGHMNIFHHFGSSEFHSEQPLFSLANMHEPGSFDLGRMADIKTKGLVIFMYSPVSIDTGIVFDLFLNATQHLAELLGGEIRTANNEILDNIVISVLREKAKSLSIN